MRICRSESAATDKVGTSQRELATMTGVPRERVLFRSQYIRKISASGLEIVADRRDCLPFESGAPDSPAGRFASCEVRIGRRSAALRITYREHSREASRERDTARRRAPDRSSKSGSSGHRCRSILWGVCIGGGERGAHILEADAVVEERGRIELDAHGRLRAAPSAASHIRHSTGGQSWKPEGVELRPNNSRKPLLPSAKFIEHLAFLLVRQGVGACDATAFVEKFREHLTQLALVKRGT
jgi:hypothetical protein